MPSPRQLVGFVLVASALGNVSAQAQAHIETPLGWARGAVSNSAVDARFAQGAAQYQSQAPIPRVALYDIAYPKDSVEALAMNGNAVLVVTAVVQDSSELPLRRVYFVSAEGLQELFLVSAVASHTADSTVRRTFGPFRLDAVYLLPLSVRATAGDLLTDFTAHRSSFRLTHFDGAAPPPLVRLGRQTTGGRPPGSAAVWTLLRREYPDLAAALPQH